MGVGWTIADIVKMLIGKITGVQNLRILTSRRIPIMIDWIRWPYCVKAYYFCGSVFGQKFRRTPNLSTRMLDRYLPSVFLEKRIPRQSIDKQHSIAKLPRG